MASSSISQKSDIVCVCVLVCASKHETLGCVCLWVLVLACVLFVCSNGKEIAVSERCFGVNQKIQYSSLTWMWEYTCAPFTCCTHSFYVCVCVCARACSYGMSLWYWLYASITIAATDWMNHAFFIQSAWSYTLLYFRGWNVLPILPAQFWFTAMAMAPRCYPLGIRLTRENARDEREHGIHVSRSACVRDALEHSVGQHNRMPLFLHQFHSVCVCGEFVAFCFPQAG